MYDLPKFIVPNSLREAKIIQDSLRTQIKIKDEFSDLQTIAGVDVGYDKIGDLAHASVVIVNFKTLHIL